MEPFESLALILFITAFWLFGKVWTLTIELGDARIDNVHLHAQMRGIDLLKAENAELTKQVQYWHNSSLRYQQLARQASIELAKGNKVVEMPLPKRQIDRLIRLCHPDKHHNSEPSKEVTQWLMSLRSSQGKS